MEIYLDNSATTRPLPTVAAAVASVLDEGFGNASSGHSRGRRARQALDMAREQIARFIMTEADRIIFVSGATEANDAVLRRAWADSNCRLITTAADHPSTHGVFAQAPERMICIPVDQNGQIEMDNLSEVLATSGPAILALGWVNGETGAMQPVREICSLAKSHGIEILIDGSQAAGRLPMDSFELDYDYLTISAHKMNGPQGVGCLALGERAHCPQLATGGGQERGFRSGTENLPGIVGFGEACLVRGKSLDTDLEHMKSLRDKLDELLFESIPRIRINGGGGPRVGTNTSICFPGIDAMALVARCDALGLYCSQVSACSTGRPEPSKALLAMGLSEADAYSSVRFSVSVQNTIADIQNAVRIIRDEVITLEKLVGRVA